MGDSLQTTNNFCTFASFKEQRSGPICHLFYCVIKNDSGRLLLLSRYVMSFSSHACHSASLLYHCCIDLCESKNLMMVNTAVTRLVRESIEWIVLALSDWIPLHSDTVQSLLASLRRCGEAAELAVWLAGLVKTARLAMSIIQWLRALRACDLTQHDCDSQASRQTDRLATRQSCVRVLWLLILSPGKPTPVRWQHRLSYNNSSVLLR